MTVYFEEIPEPRNLEEFLESERPCSVDLPTHPIITQDVNVKSGPDEEYHRNMEELGKLIRPNGSEIREQILDAISATDELSEEELMASRCLEKDIEDQLDAAYDRDNPRKIILVDMRDHNERVIDHVIDRFTGWDVRPPETGKNLYPFVPR
jgi:hypothetical protein